ncbi:MAG: flagellin, partial [Alphaproteobacteria bacterium]
MKAGSSLAKLSSGQRVVSAKDDAAALAIGSRLASEVAAMTQAGVNAGQAGSMLQIADGAMARANEILQRMKSLAVQAASGQLSNTERTILDTEYQALKSEIDRIGQDTEFNGTKLLSGGQSITAEGTGVDALVGTNGVDYVRANGITFAASATSGTLDLWTTTNANGNYTISASAAGQEFSAAISSSAFTTNLLVTPQSLTLVASNAAVAGSIVVGLNAALDNTDGLLVSHNNNTVSGTGTTSFTFKVGTGSVAA